MNNSPVIADTGVIVALLFQKDQWHEWTFEQSKRLLPPFYVCESAITESCFLLHHLPDGEQKVLQMIERGVLEINFSLSDEAENIRNLMKKYADVPMSLTDACLVRMNELIENSVVFTIDSDFLIYRKDGRKKIPLIYPE